MTAEQITLKDVVALMNGTQLRAFSRKSGKGASISAFSSKTGKWHFIDRRRDAADNQYKWFVGKECSNQPGTQVTGDIDA